MTTGANGTTAATPAPDLRRTLIESELEDAKREVRIRAATDARTFDPINDNVSTLAGLAILLAVSPDGSKVTLPRWQFWTLFCEYVATVSLQMAMTGRLRP